MNRTQTRALLSAMLFSLTLCACEAGLPTLAETGAGAGASKKGPGGFFAWAAPESSKDGNEDGGKVETKAEKRAAQLSPQARQNAQALAPRATSTGSVTKKSASRPSRMRAKRGSR